jgi:hypothetical protein
MGFGWKGREGAEEEGVRTIFDNRTFVKIGW